MRSIAIVGAAAAGTATALNLRRAGHRGPITLIGDETDLPYDRPPLSKSVLLGTAGPGTLGLATREEFTENAIDLRLGVRAVEVDMPGHLLHLADGTALAYDALVIATGASARTLPTATGYRNVHTLRGIRDAERLKEALRAGRRLGVIGGGLIGLEVAASARSLGLEVTVIEPADPPLADRLTPPVATWLLRRHEARGVTLRLGTSVTGFTADRGAVTALTLDDGAEVAVDAVLVAIGATPDVGWLESSGAMVDDGVLCDEFQRAAEDVYVVGDAARGYHPVLNRYLRMETRSNASEGAAHLAGTLMGGTAPYVPVPFFWTDQYDFKIQAFGLTQPGDEIEVVHGSLDEDRWILACRRGGRLGAVVARDRGARLIQWRRLLNEEFMKDMKERNVTV